MKSHKWKIINLKSSRLRRVRSSLRLVLKEAVFSELRRLNRIKYKGSPNTHLSHDQEIILVQQASNLMKAWSHSILSCSEGISCISLKRNRLRKDMATIGEDMVWNPLLKRWTCIHCFITYYRTEFQKSNLQNIINQKKEEEKVFNNWVSSNIE